MKNELAIINDFREHFNITGRQRGSCLPKLTLKDGTVLSVQASKFNYCCPRESVLDNTLYTEWEIGFPSVEIPEINSYAEDEDDLTNTIYAYVPAKLIQEVIDARGGIVTPSSFLA